MAPRGNLRRRAAARCRRLIAGGGGDHGEGAPGVGHEDLLRRRVEGDGIGSGARRDGARSREVRPAPFAVHAHGIAALVGDVEGPRRGVDRLRHRVRGRGRLGLPVDVAALRPLVSAGDEDRLPFGGRGLEEGVLRALQRLTDVGFAAAGPAGAHDLGGVVIDDLAEQVVEAGRSPAFVDLDVRLGGHREDGLDVELGLRRSGTGGAGAADDLWGDLPASECDAVAIGEGADVARRVPSRPRWLDQRDGASGPVVVRRVERAEGIGLGQVRRVEGAKGALRPADAVGAGDGARGPGRRRLPRGQCLRDSRGVRVRRGWARLRDADRRLGWVERVEAQDAFDLGCDRAGHLGRDRVVVPGLPRGEVVLRDRRRKGGLDLGHRAGHRERQTGRRGIPDGQPLLLQCRRDVLDGGGRRPELVGELCRRQEMAVLRRPWFGDRLDRSRQRSRITRLEGDDERQGRCRGGGPDEGRSGGNQALVAGQPLTAGPDA